MNTTITRVLLGVSIGVIYGQVMGLIATAILRQTYDPRYPGAMIPNAVEWAHIIAFVVKLIASVTGIVTGLIVGFKHANTNRDGLIGAGIGVCLFVVIALLDLLSVWTSLINDPARVWPMFLAHLGIFLVLFPIGLGLVGLATGFLATKLRL